MDEKIEEMYQEFLCYKFKTKAEDFSYKGMCENFYQKGYRKESDTAREILAEAKKWVKEHYKDKVTDSFGEREMLFMEAFGCLLSYLMGKYGVDLK